MDTETRFLRMPEVARILGCSPSTIHRRVKAGEMPHPVKHGPRMSVWPARVIQDYANSIMCNS